MSDEISKLNNLRQSGVLTQEEFEKAKNKIGRIRDIQVHPQNGKIYFLAGDKLWIMEKS